MKISEREWKYLGLTPLTSILAQRYFFAVHVFGTQLVYGSTILSLIVLKDCDSPDEALALFLLIKVRISL